MLATVGLLTGCGSAQAGSPVANGEDAAAYVSAKFDDTLNALSDQFDANDSRKTRLDQVVRFDQKRLNATVTAVQLGHPPARLSRNHSNLDSNSYLDVYHPAHSSVEYMLLGPVYASLAPTPWVQLPYPEVAYSECVWAGAQTVCKMLGAVQDSVQAGGAAKSANRKPDGSVELVAEVTLTAFIHNDVVTFPAAIANELTPEMRNQTLRTRVALDPGGKLTEIQMAGKISGNGHELEIDYHYRLDGTPSDVDLPKIPDPSQVTVLSDSAAVDDFYDRLGDIQEQGK
ncbi:hypothetical protein [Amycolatopsis viridis]|uniref:Lipoprotein n=1 Tax=Amycolatopsis viridis TaxID=185678 RepID=A0ABX0T407_9PSEU|nr:hypothetical protein [Amycolatopsis viridis]NIH82645.1 hypothetical protein [Amycolatopsis viridis]